MYTDKEAGIAADAGAMVERVALEIARKRIGSKEPVPPETVTLWDRNTAQSAIEAMREPSEAMVMTQGKKLIAELQEALKAALEWIDAVPKDVALPPMPGFDRDWAEGLLDTKAYRMIASEARSPAESG